MSNYVQWNGIGKDGGDGNKNDFLSLESGKTYRIRPLFYPYKFWKYFHKNGSQLRTAICGDPDTCPIKDRHPNLAKPVLRFAIYVIDRADGKVKILEAPQSVFRPMGNHADAMNKNPGDLDKGSDWMVKKSGQGFKTKYDVTFLADTPLTMEEKRAVKEALGEDIKKLKTIYPVDAPEEIERKLFGDSDAGESSASESEAEVPSETSRASTPNSGSANFDW